MRPFRYLLELAKLILVKHQWADSLCNRTRRHAFWLIAGFLTAFTGHATAEMAGMELVRALQSGGYHIYFRHEQTDWSQDDYIDSAGDWLSCDGNRVRQLSDRGRERARGTGNAMQQLGIPAGRVLASPYCRTMETARLLGLGRVTASEAVINMRVAHFFGGQQAVVGTARQLLASNPPPDTNTVIVSHGNVARASTPVYPAEGEAIVFHPDGKGGFDFVGRLTHQQWTRLAGQ